RSRGERARGDDRECSRARLRGSRADLVRGDAVPDRHRRPCGSGGTTVSDDLLSEDEAPVVGVLAASPSELPIMRQAGLILEKLAIPHDVRIMSASRNPDEVDLYARTAFDRGLQVIICSTGLSGHLAAAVAARTVLP